MERVYTLEDILPSLIPSKYYLVSYYLKVEEEIIIAKLRCCLKYKFRDILLDSENINSTTFVRVGVFICPKDFEGLTNLFLQVVLNGELGESCFIDNKTIFEVTESDYIKGFAYCFEKYNFDRETDSYYKIKQVDFDMKKEIQNECRSIKKWVGAWRDFDLLSVFQSGLNELEDYVENIEKIVNEKVKE